MRRVSATLSVRARQMAAVLLLSAVPGAAIADADVASLLKRIDEQDQRIRALERRLEALQAGNPVVAADPATWANGRPSAQVPTLASAPGSPQPLVRVGPDGIGLLSTDGSTQLRFGGEFTFDGRFFSDELTPDGSRSTWLVRRARPIIDGTFGGIFDYRFMPDFAGGKTIIQDAYVAARFHPWAVLTAGKFKQPFGLERLQFSANNRFLELGLPSDLVPNRDLGVQLSGKVLGGRLGYQVGWFNGTLDGVSSDANAPPDVDNNDEKDWAARLFAQPFLASDILALRGLGIGAALSYDNETGKPAATLLPAYASENQRPFFAYDPARGAAGTVPGAGATIAHGQRLRWSPQASYYYRSLGVLAEYVGEHQDVSRIVGTGATAVTRASRLNHESWQLYTTYLITGEDATFVRLVPNQSYGAGKPGWGAFELAVRYSELKLDPATFANPLGAGLESWFADPVMQARELKAWTVGINWYLTQNVEWMFDYSVTRFVGGAGTISVPTDRADEKAFLARFQVAY
jgi:phosphate-selective porin OprO/OprP